MTLRVRLLLLSEMYGVAQDGEQHGRDADAPIETVGPGAKTLTLHPRGMLRVEVIDKGMGFSEVCYSSKS